MTVTRERLWDNFGRVALADDVNHSGSRMPGGSGKNLGGPESCIAFATTRFSSSALLI